jgi:transcription initiation factor IIE alpha subunit
VRLSNVMSKEDISIYTDIPLRSVERILQYYHEHGVVKEGDKHSRVIERKTHLRDVDIQVSLSTATLLLNLWTL